MQNNCCYSIKMVIFFYCSPFSFHNSNFAIAKVVALCRSVFCFFSGLLIAFFNYCDSNSSRSFTFLNALQKVIETHSNREKTNIAIAILEKLIIEKHHNYFEFLGASILFSLILTLICFVWETFVFVCLLDLRKGK